MTYRVVQWATGIVGQEAIKGVLAHPDLELVGAWVHSPDKVGPRRRRALRHRPARRHRDRRPRGDLRARRRLRRLRARCWPSTREVDRACSSRARTS